MHKTYAQSLITQTEQNYNKTAQHYAHTRCYLTPDIQELLEYIEENDMVLDSGCANARTAQILEQRAGVEFYGIDKSVELIKLAKKHYPKGDFFVMDALDMTFEDNYFDKVLSISVMHHIPSKEYRLRYLKEIHRVLKPKGLILFRVWDLLAKPRNWFYVFKYAILGLIGKSQLDFRDLFWPWKDQTGKVIAEKYIHCFTENELKDLFKEAGFKIRKIYKDKRDIKKRSPIANIYVVGERIK